MLSSAKQGIFRQAMTDYGDAAFVSVIVMLLLYMSTAAAVAGISLSALYVALHYPNVKFTLQRCFRFGVGWNVKAVIAWAAIVAAVASLSTLLQASSETSYANASGRAFVNLVLPLVIIISGIANSTGSQLKGLNHIALAIAGVGALNLVASLVGLSNPNLTERDVFFTSRVGFESFRWQSPLTSSWQFSGIARWALPVLLIYAFVIPRNLIGLAAQALSVVLLAVVLYAVEYRAAVFPLLGGIAWLATPPILRNKLSLCFLAYMFIAPLLITSEIGERLLVAAIPDWIEFFSGTSLKQLVTFTARSEIWTAALSVLREGNLILYGQGYYQLDASTFHLTELARYGGFIQKISFHQGALDLIFMAGIAGSLALVFIPFFYLTRKCLFGHFAKRGSQPLLALGLVALTNSHDGFFNVHLLFLGVIAVALLQGPLTASHGSDVS